MIRISIFVFIMFFPFFLLCQKNQDVAPIGGINALALEYYKIDFTKDQRDSIGNKQLEFIYFIDTSGIANLREVNGISDHEIVDSLLNKDNVIPRFKPQITDGKKVEMMYFMLLEFPTYTVTERHIARQAGYEYNEANLEDFEYLNKSGRRFDIVFGGMMNQFTGNASKHLKLGGGMKVAMNYTNKKKHFFGFDMNLYGNKLKSDYPLNTVREQLEGPPTLLFGLTAGKWFSDWNMQFEIGFAIHNLTEKLNDTDTEWIQLNGWSPGIVFNYPIKFGKDKPLYYYGQPSLYNNYVNLNFGIRPVFYSLKEARGVMLEIGIAYRLGVHHIKEFKLKN